jgi:hypothetical protein
MKHSKARSARQPKLEAPGVVLDRGTRATLPRSFPSIAASSSAMLFCARKPGCFTLKDNDPKAQEALEKMRSAWDQAPVETALNGQRVRIAGFVVPLERKGEQILEFLLVPYFGACIHVPPPPANQIIHVIPEKPVTGMRTMDAMWVSGTLKLDRSETGMGVSGYRLRGEALAPYTRPKT